jgi:predicted PurR-regulated permease PerM
MRGGIEESSRDNRVYKWAAIIILLLAAVYGLSSVLWELRTLLLDVILAITVASAIAPLAEKLERFRIPRFITVLLVYGSVVSFYALVFCCLYAPLKEQSQLLATQLPHFSDRVKDSWSHVLGFLGDNVNMLPEIHATDFREPALSLARKTLDITAGVMGLAVNAVLVLFLAAYFVIEAKRVWENLILWVPPAHRKKIGGLILPVGARMGGYVRGQMLVSTAVACFFGIGFYLIGLKYSLVLGLLAGILNLVPYVGSLFATVIALFVASTQSVTIFLLTMGVFAVEQFVESNFIVPHLLGKQVDMHPLLVMFAILIGGSLGGAIGALVAVPLTGALLLIASEFYFKPLNGLDKEPAAPGATPTPPPVADAESKSNLGPPPQIPTRKTSGEKIVLKGSADNQGEAIVLSEKQADEVLEENKQKE